MTDVLEPASRADDSAENGAPQSLATAAARNLSSTHKTVPQMQGITPRWLSRMLPWVQVSGGTYRVNRRLTYLVGDGLLTFTSAGGTLRVVPRELGELPMLRDFDDDDTLTALADGFEQHEFGPGETIVHSGRPVDELYLIAHGKVSRTGPGKYGEETSLGTLADGHFFGEEMLANGSPNWQFTVRTVTRCTMLRMRRDTFERLRDQSDPLRAHIGQWRVHTGQPQNRHGEAEIDLAAGHTGEPTLPGTFVDYELSPREYELSLAQTVLRVHTRVADLYNEPMNQVEQQLRLTIQALRERQEYELLNNPEFGLLHNVNRKHRVHTRSGPPTPDDLDDLLTRRRKTAFFLAHPRTIAAFGRECTKRGVYPQPVEALGKRVMAWRGVPMLPSEKIPVSRDQVSSILAMRTGEKDEGVVALTQVGLPDEVEPGLSARFMGINEKAVLEYLVSTYYSAAVLVPDALGVLDNVEIAH